ncbi:glycosyltransferase family 2 protein [Niameybacter massiliensis]|uniref:glycosyltransferase family 2 protein n=1 Tax=Niameybacter massiliensis TaxID=1658108 RepID=UPI0006B4EFFA|nr:glycosyltransferase [Niameybacter massiliensis]
MIEPLISIIVPIYKVEDYIEKCITSILDQTYKNLEIILADDGSPDGCGEICDQYAEMDSRIKVIHKENGGLSSARNTGLDIASGEYIGFVDSDDYIEKDMYEQLYNAIKKHKVEIAVCNFKRVYEKMREEINRVIPYSNQEVFTSRQVLLELHKEPFLWNLAVNKLYSRRLFKEIRYTEGMIFEDMDIAHKIFRAATSVVYIASPLYCYYQREDSILHTVYSVRQLDKLVALKHRMDFAKQEGIKELMYYTQQLYADAILRNYILLKDEVKDAPIYIDKVVKDYRRYVGGILINPLMSTKYKMALLLFGLNPKYYDRVISIK